jgi:hypothetical protein
MLNFFLDVHLVFRYLDWDAVNPSLMVCAFLDINFGFAGQILNLPKRCTIMNSKMEA